MTEDAIEVPWRVVPVSEPLLPGEFSAELRAQRGRSVYFAALVSVIAGVSTTEARRLVEEGAVSVDGAPATGAFGYLKPGSVVRVAALPRILNP
jgi:alkanesulfonate monooxygenase SsuD/methylene tetrahydromethanopterin reductase-like flavin-dependent oxidoreductase (luciferase family)